MDKRICRFIFNKKIKEIIRRNISLLLAGLLLFGMVISPLKGVYAATNLDTGISGLTAAYENGTWSVSGNTLSGSATGTASGGCSDATSVTSTLTITNSRSGDAMLSFRYTAPVLGSGGSVTVDGTAMSAAGTFQKNLTSGASVKVVIISGSAGAYTSSIELKDLQLITEQEVTVTFLPAETGGSYSVDGNTITASLSFTRSSTTPFSLNAVPASGYKLMGWYSSVSGYFSSEKSLSIMFDRDQEVRPLFILSDAPVFDAGGSWFDDLNAALDYAETQNTSKITLISDGTLPSGSYHIPAGKTLLIPYDSAATLSTTSPDLVKSTAPASPSAFRTLRMASGADLTVSGAVCVNAKLNSTNTAYTGVTTGKYGYLKLDEGSRMTLKDSAKLYCWGYISGEGEILAESGAEVYEPLQICDLRGGTATSSLNNNDQKVLPFSQYYVQNIESPLTLAYGAKAYAVGSVTVQGMTETPNLPFVGTSGCMFSMLSGSTFTKSYSPAEDRMTYEVTGSASLNPVTISAGITINTKNYVLPIMENTTISVHQGSILVNQDICMLPGSRLLVDADAKVSVTSGYHAYVYDRDDYIGKGFIFSNTDMKASYYSPTRKAADKFTPAKMTDALVDINGEISVSGDLYTTGSGADITSSGKSGKVSYLTTPAASSTTYQATQNGTAISYTAIPVNSAWLHNGDSYRGTEEEYTKTAGSVKGDTVFYCEIHDKWEKTCDAEESFTITFLDEDGETVLDRQELTEGTLPIYNGKVLEKAADQEQEYTFSGWIPEITEVTQDAVYTASYTGNPHDFKPDHWTWSGNDTEGYTGASLTFLCGNGDGFERTEPAVITTKTTDPGCETEGKTVYTATVSFEGKTYTNTKTVVIPATGHEYEFTGWTWAEEIDKEGTATGYTKAAVTFTCKHDAAHTVTVEDTDLAIDTVEPTFAKQGSKTYTAEITGPDGEIYTDSRTILLEAYPVIRMYGSNRYETAMLLADKTKEEKGIKTFDTMILASGTKFADALSGSYLASVKGAPILLAAKSDKNLEPTIEYIKANLSENGTLYILGGPEAVSERAEELLGDKKKNVKRLYGKDRYLTNLEILKEAAINGDELLVATGKDFGDSLSASSLGRPILLVKKAITEEQTDFLKENRIGITILGGEEAVTKEVEDALSKLSLTIERLQGKNRYETSFLIAKKYFEAPEEVILAYGVDYPDGLCAGSYGAYHKAPVILANTSKNGEPYAEAYVKETGSLKKGCVIGGNILIQDSTILKVFGLNRAEDIKVITR